MFFLFQKTVKYKIYFVLRSTAIYVFSPVTQWMLLCTRSAKIILRVLVFCETVCIFTLFHSMIRTKLQWSEKMGADGHVQCHSSKRQRIINDNRKDCQKYVFREIIRNYLFYLSNNQYYIIFPNVYHVLVYINLIQQCISKI